MKLALRQGSWDGPVPDCGTCHIWIYNPITMGFSGELWYVPHFFSMTASVNPVMGIDLTVENPVMDFHDRIRDSYGLGGAFVAAGARGGFWRFGCRVVFGDLRVAAGAVAVECLLVGQRDDRGT